MHNVRYFYIRRTQKYFQTETLPVFNKVVNEHLTEGWQLVGGASLAILTIHKHDGVFFQYEYTQGLALYDNIIRNK